MVEGTMAQETISVETMAEETMTGRTYAVGTVAELAGVTVRALHHYDEIGLLVPSERTAAGYRRYTRADLERLQQIRLHRHLGLSLEEIRRLLEAAPVDVRATLREQRAKLLTRIEEARALVAVIDSMLAADEEGERTVPDRELFSGFRPEEHEAEAERRWGSTDAWKESKRRTAAYGSEQWRAIQAEHDEIVATMAELAAAGAAPDSAEAIGLAERHRRHVDRWYYACGRDLHTGLGALYVRDPRFAETFERRAPGLAAWIEAAIRANAATAREAER